MEKNSRRGASAHGQTCSQQSEGSLGRASGTVRVGPQPSGQQFCLLCPHLPTHPLLSPHLPPPALLPHYPGATDRCLGRPSQRVGRKALSPCAFAPQLHNLNDRLPQSHRNKEERDFQSAWLQRQLLPHPAYLSQVPFSLRPHPSQPVPGSSSRAHMGRRREPVGTQTQEPDRGRVQVLSR